ncbi:hypothetical protein LJC52_01640 [Bacteroidales bacterium OttesenSCG-928-A17]|nr:hypothetical protein [Bacteroidales bacterium OttesenSCG-928-A17]
MKNINYFLVVLCACFGFSTSGFAQQVETVANGLIKLSDETNEYWYYIGNGHNSDVAASSYPINDSDGRFCSMITAPAAEASNVVIESILNDWNDRVSQKWKVVASDEADFYYLVNKEGKYLTYNSTRCPATSTPPPATGSDNYKFQIAQTTAHATNGTESTWVTIKRKSGNYYIAALNQGADWQVESNNGNVPPALRDNGLNGSPRAWHFAEESKIDVFYPMIDPAGTAVGDVREWFRIKTVDASVTGDEKYLSIDTETKAFSLVAKAELDNQMFAFVNSGYQNKSHTVKILSKATGEYFNLDAGSLTTDETGKAWVLKHVYSPTNSAQSMQAVIREHRWSEQHLIITNKLDAAQPTWTKSLLTFDNEYTWAFERILFPASVATGANYTILEPTVVQGLTYGQEFVVKYTVAEGYIPTIVGSDTPGVLVDGVYTYKTVVTGPTTVMILVNLAQNVVTINAEDYVTVTSPTLNENNEYHSGSSFTLSFKLAEGYENPVINVNGAIVGDPVLNGTTYSATVSAITTGAVINISASLMTLPVAVTKSDEITLTTTPEANVEYGDEYKVSFTVADTYHTPLAVVNGKYAALSVDAGTYTLTIDEVKEATTIQLKAFAANVVPVVGDTWVREGADFQLDYSQSDILAIQYSTYANKYMRRAYLEFDLNNISADDYGKAVLKLVYKKNEKNGKFIMEVRTVDPLLQEVPMNEMTWNANGEIQLSPSGMSLTDPLEIPAGTVNTSYDFDLSDYLLDNAGFSVRLQLNGLTGGTDGCAEFYSLEGAALVNLDYLPVIVFGEKTYYDVTVTKTDQVTIESPAESSPYSVAEGEEFELKFTVAAGHVLADAKINEVSATDAELTEEEGVYTLIIESVTEDISIDITTSPDVSIDDIQSAIELSAENKHLTISTPMPVDVEIYSATGILVAKKTVNGKESIYLGNGVYLVKVGDKVYKKAL